MVDSAKLHGLLLSVPQELYDKIFSLTFEVDIGTVKIDKNYVSISLSEKEAIKQLADIVTISADATIHSASEPCHSRNHASDLLLRHGLPLRRQR